MLNEPFLSRLSEAFPSFYARVDDEARAEAARLRTETGGDVEKALARARMVGAARLWWPYVQGTIPVVGKEQAAMEGFARLVLTVDHLVGYEPETMEAARDQVVGVLRHSLDFERLRDIVTREDSRSAKAAVAGAAGLMASMSALMAPVTMVRTARKWIRFVPGWGRVAVAGVLAGALASVPVVAGYSAGQQAEKAARARAEASQNGRGPKVDLTRAA